MKRFVAALLGSTWIAGAAFAQAQAAQSVEQVANDAMVIDRVAEASKRDLPTDLLKRIVDEDIELLRGRRTDGSYEYATYERFESGRTTKSFSINPSAEKMETVEVRGSNVYRLIVEVPSRRMLVRKNRPVWVERIDVNYIAQGSTQSQQQSFEVKAWMQPGESRPVDLPAIARQATAKVIVTAEKDGSYGNIDLALVQARIVDLASSPYAEAVASAKAIQRALNNGELPSVRASAQRMRDALGGSGTIAVIAARPEPAEATPVAPDTATQLEMRTELQLIEDLLTGNESERREGLDKLHQMIRRMR
jgi:hypothetical protein